MWNIQKKTQKLNKKTHIPVILLLLQTNSAQFINKFKVFLFKLSGEFSPSETFM